MNRYHILTLFSRLRAWWQRCPYCLGDRYYIGMALPGTDYDEKTWVQRYPCPRCHGSGKRWRK